MQKWAIVIKNYRTVLLLRNFNPSWGRFKGSFNKKHLQLGSVKFCCCRAKSDDVYEIRERMLTLKYLSFVKRNLNNDLNFYFVDAIREMKALIMSNMWPIT
jgi:hypothetical protein